MTRPSVNAVSTALSPRGTRARYRSRIDAWNSMKTTEERDGDHGGGQRSIEDAPAHRGHQARSLTTSPSSPLGRKIRIRMRIENAKMSLYSAPKAPPVSSDR